jgi:hypothetical protein
MSLVGYFLGALLISNIPSPYHSGLNPMVAVELYGDPCWYNSHGRLPKPASVRRQGGVQITLDKSLKHE